MQIFKILLSFFFAAHLQYLLLFPFDQNFPCVSKQVHPVLHVMGQFSAAPSLEQRLPVLLLTNVQVRGLLPLNVNLAALSWQYELSVVGEVTGIFVGGDVTVAFVGAGVTGVIVGGGVTVACVGARVARALAGGDAPVAFVGAGVTGVFVGGDVTGVFVGSGVTGVFVGGDVTGKFVGSGVTGVFVGAGVETSQLSVACPVAYTKIRAVPPEELVSREQTLTMRVPELDQL